ncbi:MAG: DNA-binding protein [Armatimonadota bacterium]|nr:MAG: DNA-binding protein [Armatimonadota bacterium]
MQRDWEIVEETREWIARAREDLELARYALTAQNPFISPALFHAQQAAEKALEAFLTWHSVLFCKTHSIEELGEQCLQVDQSMAGTIDRATPLTEYAWRFRYPGAPFSPSLEDAKYAIVLAEEVLDVVLTRLPKEVTD